MSTPQAILQEAVLLHRAGRFPEAIARYARYTQLAPNDLNGWKNLAMLSHQAGDLPGAAQAVSKALGIRPSDTQTLLLAGNVRQDLGDLEGAAKHFEKAVRIDPAFAQAHNNLGIVLRTLGFKDRAAKSFRAAVRAKPDYMRAWNNLGSTLLHLERPEEAVECFRKALALDPNYAYAHLNLGLYHVAAGSYADAEASLLRAIQLEPRFADAHFGLGRLYREMMDLERSEQALRRSLELNPRGVDALLHLAEVLAEQGQRGAALDCYRRAVAQKPSSLQARLGLALTLPQVYASAGEVDRVRAEYAAGLAALPEAIAGVVDSVPVDERVTSVQWNNFYLAYQGRDDRELQAAFARLQRSVLETVVPEFYRPLEPKPRGGRKLRVGFVSQFFYRCTAGNYFMSWVTGLDPARFETFVYSLHQRPDDLTREVEGAAAHFVRTSASLASLARQIRADDLDVLVYPELGMNRRVFTLASLRLAPLQCAGWGHPVTSGHDNVDVFFSSEVMEPPQAQAHYTERLVTLPGIGTSYPRPRLPEPATRASLGLPEDAVLYLFPQSLFKVHPDNDDLLLEILVREPRAALVMFQSRFEPITRQFVDRLSRRFEQRGISTQGRVRLMPTVGHDDYLRVNLACDVMLDSLYWSGGNTSLDAIACGLPVVTRPGQFMRGRQSAGMLRILGVDELVVQSDEEYVETALRLGRDRDHRDAIRARMAASSDRLFGQARAVEALGEFLLSQFPDRPG